MIFLAFLIDVTYLHKKQEDFIFDTLKSFVDVMQVVCRNLSILMNHVF